MFSSFNLIWVSWVEPECFVICVSYGPADCLAKVHLLPFIVT